MSAKDLLQGLKSTVEIQSTVNDNNVQVTPIYGSEKSCKANVLVPIEGSIKIYEVTAKEIGTYDSLKIE